MSDPPARPSLSWATPALLALAALTGLRLAVAALAPLAPDEAYYWVWSRALQPGYLDHPPMVALWIRAGTWIAGDTALGIRLLGPVSAALGSVLLWDAAEALLPGRRAGLVAAALLNATLLFGVGTVIMTPDTPLLFFWTGCLWALARFQRAGSGGWLIVAALAAGAAMDSKYTAAFLPLGAALWLLWVPSLRAWLWRPATWGAALLGLLAFAPVVAWNAAHGWASFLKQGGRLGAFDPARTVQFLGELVGAQFGLATPLVFVLSLAGLAVAAREAWRRRDPAWTLLACMTLPALAVFLQHTMGGRVQGNWPAILYPAAAIAAAGVEGRAWRRLRAPAVGLGLVISLAAYLQAVAAPFPLPARRDPTALQLRGWGGLAAQVDAAARRSGAAFVAADDYGPAAELAWSLPAGIAMVGVEKRWAFFALPRPALAGRGGLLVRKAEAGPPPAGVWGAATPLGVVWRRDSGQRIEGFRLFRVRLRAGAVAAVLPRR